MSVFIIKNPSSFFSHLVPLGTPAQLAPFIVLIELLSLTMRPFTLAVRLAANIIAGHLLIELTATAIIISEGVLIAHAVVLTALITLIILELRVAVIQRYVYTRLASLYLREVNVRNILSIR